jgi:APA family basic amino acid/polyamine antiporter
MLGPRKSLTDLTQRTSGHALAKTLSWPHLIALGVGAIVGTGIYTLTGVGAERAGPAVILAFAIAGAVCACAALAYAEMATLIPAAGSAYTFSYVALGEQLAWIVGWSLILEYSLACSTVAVGWSGYLVGWIESAGIHLPHMLLVGPHGGGLVNLPAVLVALGVMGLLVAGTRESATLNIVLVIIKLVALSIFVIMALPAFQGHNLHPFMPYGFGSTEIGGEKRGVMAAAAIVFFAFYGFDAVATSAEEAKNPGRDLTIGIVGSMLVCTLIYMAVAISAIGALPFQQLANSPEPLALVLRSLGQPMAAHLIALAAVIALPSVILVMMYGQSRVFFVMARDGLLPARSPRSARAPGAGADHAADRGFDRHCRGHLPPGRNRRTGQCRHADRIHGRGCLPDGPASPRPRTAAPVPLPPADAGGHADDPGLRLSAAEPAQRHAGALCRVERLGLAFYLLYGRRHSDAGRAERQA